MKLYGYWRSSAAYRVRIALHLKEIDFESISVHLVKNGGEQHTEEYSALNPSHLVPTLVDGDLVLNQSVAIIDYLDNLFPDVALYPDDLALKAKVQALSLDIACEMHPINNLRVQQYLVKELNVTEQEKMDWVQHWMKTGFASIEAQLVKTSGQYCFADQITFADICLVPQVYNAKRFGVDLSLLPNICRVVSNCQSLIAFEKAHPDNQIDAQ
ncbi:MAG: maleylacetoacetate isomerase [Colwellia sp.]|nr:maleylacetoacetate isomerase [Colwellia sp.]